MDQAKLDNLIDRIINALPQGMSDLRHDLEKNLHTTLRGVLAGMDLVTREEFDLQSDVLARTRAKLDQLEKQILDLEQTIEASGKK